MANFCNDKIPFGVKSSNISTVAKFSSTLDEAYILIIANSNNNFNYNDSSRAIIYGGQNIPTINTSYYEGFMGTKNNNVIHKILRFNDSNIYLDNKTIISGDLLPSSSETYNIGSENNKWKELYLSGNSLHLSDLVISSDSVNNSLVISDSFNKLAPITVSELRIQSDSSNYSTIGIDSNGFYIMNNNNKIDLSWSNSNINWDDNNNTFTVNGTLVTSNLMVLGETYQFNVITSNYITSNMDIEFSNYFNTRTTDNLREGTSNHYYTDTKFDTRLALKSTTNLSEGNNLYYTNARVDARIALMSPTQTIGLSSNTTTSQIREGSNLYYTDSRVDTRIALKTTDNITEGANNLYYTSARANNVFDAQLGNKTTDNLIQGTHNKYIIDNVYNNSLNVTGTLIASNIMVLGSNVLLNTTTYNTEKLEIINNGTGPALHVVQNGFQDIASFYNGNTIALSILNGGNVGIKTTIAQYALDINGTARASLFIGSGALLTSVNISDLTTSLLTEGSNLYYTVARNNANFDTRLSTKSTSQLIEGSNLYYTNARVDARIALLAPTTSGLNSNTTTSQILEGSNLYYTDSRFDTRLALKSTTNIAEGNNLYYTNSRVDARIALVGPLTSGLSSNTTTSQISEGSNLYYTDARFDTRMALKSTTNLVEGNNLYYTNARVDARIALVAPSSGGLSSNITTSQIREGSNLYYSDSRFDTRLALKTTDNIIEGTTNLYYTSARANNVFDAQLGNKTTDNLTQGIHNKYIIDNVYNNSLAITGTLTASNIMVLGSNVLLNTSTYNTEKLEVINNGTGPTLNVIQNGAQDIAYFYNNSSIALSIINGGNVGIKTLAPLYALDINGTARASLFIGSGNLLTSVNLQDRTTSLLVEGSNLYYTQTRVDTSFDNRLSTKSTTELSEGSNLYYTQSRVDSSFDSRLSTKSTTQLLEGSNLYYTQSRADTSFDNRLSTKSTTELSEGSNLYYTQSRVDTSFDNRLSTKSTTELSEGSNLYYTQSRAGFWVKFRRRRPSRGGWGHRNSA